MVPLHGIAELSLYQEIMKGRGTQFAPKVVDAFSATHDQVLDVLAKYRD